MGPSLVTPLFKVLHATPGYFVFGAFAPTFATQDIAVDVQILAVAATSRGRPSRPLAFRSCWRTCCRRR